MERKHYGSVMEMVRATTNDQQFVDALERQIEGRRIVRELICLRLQKNLTQAQVAEKIGVTQSNVAKFEAKEDAGLRLGYVARYLKALGCDLEIHLVPTTQAEPTP